MESAEAAAGDTRSRGAPRDVPRVMDWPLASLGIARIHSSSSLIRPARQGTTSYATATTRSVAPAPSDGSLIWDNDRGDVPIRARCRTPVAHHRDVDASDSASSCSARRPSVSMRSMADDAEHERSNAQGTSQKPREHHDARECARPPAPSGQRSSDAPLSVSTDVGAKEQRTQEHERTKRKNRAG
jgi:hypothetical protein